jgi:hypothetical protein
MSASAARQDTDARGSASDRRACAHGAHMQMSARQEIRDTALGQHRSVATAAPIKRSIPIRMGEWRMGQPARCPIHTVTVLPAAASLPDVI